MPHIGTSLQKSLSASAQEQISALLSTLSETIELNVDSDRFAANP